MDHKKFDHQYVYQIQFLGEISQTRADWFANMDFTSHTNHAGVPITTITGTVLDQAHLRSLLYKIWDLNLEVILVRRIDKLSIKGDKINE
jgi:hypothetical protein